MKIVGLSGWGIPVSAPREALPSAVSNIRTSDPENHIFSNVGGMISHPFQIPRNRERIQGLDSAIGLRLHVAGERGKRFVIHSVNFVVRFEHMSGDFGIALN